MLIPNFRTYLIIFIVILWSGTSVQMIGQTYDIKPLKIGRGSEQVFATDYYNGQLFFCSNAKSKHAKNIVNEDNTRFLNLYQIALSEDFIPIKKAKPQILSENVNSNLNEGPIFFDKNSNEGYFSSNVVTDTTQISLKLFSTKYNAGSGEFSARATIDLDWGDGNYSNPTISSDGKTMIFSFTSLTDTNSNLFYANKKGDSWSIPQPLNELNTLYNETFPRLCGNTLYFVSDRPGGEGGLDIYKCSFLNGKPGAVTPLPKPINSSFDDFLFFEVSNSEGFFSSNRVNGQDRIYKFKRDLPMATSFEESNLNFCYTFQDEVILDKNQYDYMWEFGDGTKKNGGIVEHCYKDTGVYEISCHLMDIESLEIEENIIQGVIEVITEYPIIDYKDIGDGRIEVFLNQKWARNSFENYYWIVDGNITTEKTLQLNASETKPITVKVVLWKADQLDDVVGLLKTINLND